MAGIQLCAALPDTHSTHRQNEKVVKFVDSTVAWFYEICHDSSYHETLCTAWNAASLLRLIVGRALKTIEPTFSSLDESAPPYMDPLAVYLLTLSSKIQSRDYSFKMDALSDRFDRRELGRVERFVLETIEFRTIVASPHYFLHSNAFNLDLNEGELRRVERMLVECAKTSEICETCRSGSIVVACAVLSRASEEQTDVSQRMEVLVACACVDDEQFQRAISFEEVCFIVETFSTLLGAVRVDPKERFTPITIRHDRREARRARRFCDPVFSQQRYQDYYKQFPDESYISPKASTRGFKRINRVLSS